MRRWAIQCLQRQRARRSAEALRMRILSSGGERGDGAGTSPLAAKRGISLLLAQADVRLGPGGFVVVSLAVAAALTLVLSPVLSPYALPIVFCYGLSVFYRFLDERAMRRAASFAEEYPSVLLAAASSIRAGMTAYGALERATQLLPKESFVRRSIERLLQDLAKGMPRHAALAAFASDIRLPELALFRSAFLLVLQHGGRFGPTLERLARVCQDRTTQIRAARASTATMKLTAHTLLVLSPLIVGLVALRTDDYLSILCSHPVANTVGSIGILTIAASYATLRRMSDFRP